MPVDYMTGITIDGNTIGELRFSMTALAYQPGVEWFNDPVDKDSVLGQPNTFSWAAAANYGRVGVDSALRMSSIHFHLMSDGSGGQYDLEIYRFRNAAFVRIATCTLAGGAGDGGFANFSFTSEDARLTEAGDYFFLQATAKMTGTPVGFVDVHYDSAPLIINNP